MILYESFGEPKKVLDDNFLKNLKSELSTRFNKKLRKRLQVLKSNSTKYKKAKKKLNEEIKHLIYNDQKNQQLITVILGNIKEVLATYDDLSEEVSNEL